MSLMVIRRGWGCMDLEEGVETLLQVVMAGWIRKRRALHDGETSFREQGD